MDEPTAPAEEPAQEQKLSPGDRVIHRLFGPGLVLKVDESPGKVEVQVLFDAKSVGKKTLAVILGRAGTRIEYAACIGVAYAVAIGLGLAGMVGMWWWLPLLSLPLAIWLVRFVSRTDGRPLNQALKRTGQLHLLFGLLFALGLWLG